MKKYTILCLLLMMQGKVISPIYAQGEEQTAEQAKITSGEALTLLDIAKIAIVNSPDIERSNLDLEIAKATEQIETGSFDFNTHVTVGYNNMRDAVNTQVPEFLMIRDDRDSKSSSAGISKLFRSGISTDLSVRIERMDPRDIFPEAYYTDNHATVSFEITIPLLRGRGISASGSETAARLEKEATALEIQQSISSILLDAVRNYWEYKHSLEALRVQEKSKERVEAWLNANSSLRNNTTNPAIQRLEGYLSDKKRQVVSAKDAVNTAKSELASSLGIPADQVDLLGEPVSEFPIDWENVLAKFDQQHSKNKWLNTALQQRLDLQAARLRQQASATLVEKAKQDSLPGLDLALSAGYNGYEAGNNTSNYFNSLHHYVRGANSSASLTFSYPLENNTAKGILSLKRAIDQQNKIAVDELVRQISLEIGVSASNVVGLLSSSVESAKTTESYYAYLQQVTSDNNFVTDSTKVVDAVDLEDKLITALLEHYTSLNDLAKTIATVRHQTGSLIISNNADYEVKLDDLTSLPIE